MAQVCLHCLHHGEEPVLEGQDHFSQPLGSGDAQHLRSAPEFKVRTAAKNGFECQFKYVHTYCLDKTILKNTGGHLCAGGLIL